MATDNQRVAIILDEIGRTSQDEVRRAWESYAVVVRDPTRSVLVEILESERKKHKKVCPARVLYRQRVKQITDELVVVRYSNSQLEEENKKLKAKLHESKELHRRTNGG